MIAMFPKAAKDYRRQITLGLDQDPRAADKARAILRNTAWSDSSASGTERKSMG